jgi:hypothetical protein
MPAAVVLHVGVSWAYLAHIDEVSAIYQGCIEYQSSPPEKVPLTGMVWHFRAAWLRLNQTDLISSKGQFR